MTKDQILELTRALKALGATHVEIGPDGRVKCDFPDEARPFLPVLPAPEPWRRRLVPPMATMYACPDSWEPSTTGGAPYVTGHRWRASLSSRGGEED